MRKSAFVLVFLWCYVVLHSASAAQDTNAAALLARAPLIRGDSYRCEDMVLAVNCLRHLGKERALTALKDYLRNNDPYAAPGEHKKILLVCRLLFTNPQGWKAPRLGQPIPEIDWKTADQIPLFPLALARGVPFLVIRGYGAGGFTSDTAEKCVQLCEGLSLIAADLPEQGYKGAAEDLIASETFQTLYLKPEARKESAEMILAQAQPASEKAQKQPVPKSKIDLKIEGSPR